MRHAIVLLRALPAFVLVQLFVHLCPGLVVARERPDIREALGKLPLLDKAADAPFAEDWLVVPPERKAAIYRTEHPCEVVMTNGLVRRTFRLAPGAATVDYSNLMTDSPVIRGVKPEAIVELDGTRYSVGGLLRQPEYGYLRPEWIDLLERDPQAFQLRGLSWGNTVAPFPWKRKRYAADLPWPPPGVSLTLSFVPPGAAHRGLTIDVRYELYDGRPLMAKWLTISNGTTREVVLDRFVSEQLAVVESESSVEVPDRWRDPPMHVESDYAFHGMTYGSANETTHWVPDPQYRTQVNYRRETPVLLESRPKIGPHATIPPGESFSSFRTYELLYDSDDRERRGLAVRRMYRTVAPWVTENPILMHVRYSDSASIRRAVDQCVEVGFEMVILTFGSGFNMESEDPEYIARIRADVEYAHSRGIELGGYSLLASRRISPEHDVIHPDTGKPGGAIYGNSPCLSSAWGEDYFRRIQNFIQATNMDLLEHDGNYPGDVCASTRHPHHHGLEDSQWRQWKKITAFYRWCRARGVYLNVPDWYFLNGSSKVGMGYRETNWSLPRARQILLGRQNIYDGTWEKTPSMGWMFVPLVEYHGGGAAATLEPLSEHLDAYEAHLMQNFGSGVQACYRGPRLFDTEETRAVVKRWVDFYRRYRRLLDSDIIHVRRPDARDLDCMLHVNAQLRPRGLAMVYNPTAGSITKELRLPLYYTGLTETAKIREKEGSVREYRLDREYNVRLPVAIPARSASWFVVE